MLVVNLFGGPGSGKSTLAAGLFYDLKVHTSAKVEMAREFAKDLVWEKRSLVDQVYILGEQHHRLNVLKEAELDIAITDSPLLLAMYYTQGRPYEKEVAALALALHQQYQNLNIWVTRDGPYQCHGRRETEEDALGIDKALYAILRKNDITIDYCVTKRGVSTLFNIIHMRSRI